jgi:hypothetical protein
MDLDGVVEPSYGIADDHVGGDGAKAYNSNGDVFTEFGYGFAGRRAGVDTVAQATDDTAAQAVGDTAAIDITVSEIK